MRAEDLVSGVVRIWSHGGTDEEPRIVGTGFLVAPDLVLTCAHVAARSWGGDPADEEGLGREVRLDFPASAPQKYRAATVVRWLPRRPAPGGAYDLAGLALDGAAPAGARPLPLVAEDAPWGRPCRAFGFPAGRPDGAYAAGELREVLANGWLLVKGGAEAREFTRPGYSGGPVITSAGVVGLLTEGDRDVRVREAVMVPVRTILGAWPALHQVLSRSPYPGLAAFTAHDAPFFRGRDAVAAELAAALAAPPHLVVLAGPSGSGKSSLLAAGVLPRVDSARAAWTPGKAPYSALSRALLAAKHPEADEVQLSVQAARLARDLDSGRVTLPDFLAQDLTRWVIAVDQPEELVLEANGNGDGSDERLDGARDEDTRGGGLGAHQGPPSPARRLFDALLDAHSDERLEDRLAVIIAVRTDDLDNLLRLPRLAAKGNGETVRYLGAVEDLREVIEGPLAQAGFAGLEAGLTDRLLADVADVPNPLPLLQFTLAELWRNQHAGRLTHVAYDDLGGVRRAIANHAERMVAAFGNAELDAIRDVFLQLGRPGLGDSVARRAARYDELGERGKLLVPRLAAARLVVTDRDADGVERVEVAHEALFEHWPRLKAWWQESVGFRRWQESMRFALRVWREGGEDPVDLLHGPRLRSAEAHLRDRPAAFTAAEFAYVMRSGERELEENEAASAALKRQLRLRRRLNLVLALGLAVAVGLATVTVLQVSSMRKLRAEAERLLHSATDANAALGALTTELEESLGESQSILAARLGIEAVAMSAAPTTFGGDMRLAGLMAAHAVRLDPGPESLDRLLRVLQAHPTYRATLDVTASAVALSPDGRSVLVGRADGTLQLFDGFTGAKLGAAVKGHTGPVAALAFSRGGQALSGGQDGRLIVWKIVDGLARAGTIGDGVFGPIAAVATTGDAGLWVVTDLKGKLGTFDTTSGALRAQVDARAIDASARPLAVTVGPIPAVSRGAVSPAPGAVVDHDGGIPVAAAAVNGLDQSALSTYLQYATLLAVNPVRPVIALPSGSEVAVLDTATLGRLWAVPVEPDALAAITFNSDGSELVVVTVDGRVQAFDVGREGKGTMLTWVSRIGDPRVATYGSAPGELLVGAGDGTARRVDYRRGEIVGPDVRGQDQPLSAVLVGPQLVVTASRDGRVVTWDREARSALGGMVAQVDFRPKTAAFDAGRSWLYLGSDVDGRLTRLDLTTGDVVARLEGAHAGGVLDIALGSSGDELVTGGRDGRFVARDPVSLEEVSTLFQYDRAIVSVRQHPTVHAWLVGANQGFVAQVPAGMGDVTTLRPAPKGTWAPGAVVATDATGLSMAVALEDLVELWRDGGVVARARTDPGRNVKELQFSPDGQKLLGSGSGHITLWNVASMERVATWFGERAALSPDGTLLALADGYGDVRLLDATTLAPIGGPLPGGGDYPEDLQFTQDGGSLLMVDYGGGVWIWRTSVRNWLEAACALAWRDLSGEEVARFMGVESYKPVCTL